MSRPRAVLSVDFEFWEHTPAYRSASGDADEDAVGLDAVDFLLDAFDAAGAETTFFTVSEIAVSHPGTIERVVGAGHEIGSHTHTHRHLSTLSPSEQHEELERSRELLGRRIDSEVTGVRAPSFDMPANYPDLLVETGYEYDSSVVPARGIPGWYGGTFDTCVPSPASSVWDGGPDSISEVPVSVMPGLRLPLTGAWLRFFGLRYTILGMRLLARRGIAPVLYVHPWELVDLPEVDGVPFRVYWRSGRFLRRAVKRILAEPFEFVPARTLAEEVLADGPGSPGGTR